MLCPDFENYHIVVIGDAMLDRYWHGDTYRISPEAPVPIVKIERDEYRVGGAANVALNLASLGCRTSLISIIGDDENGKQLSKMLFEQKVDCHFVFSEKGKTISKLRVIGRHQQLIRLDFEDKFSCQVQQIIEKLAALIDKADLIILSDYAKGTLSDVHKLIQYIHRKHKKVIVDPKSADLSIYRGADLLTPNLGEFEAMVGVCANQDEIVSKGVACLEHIDIKGLLVTRGAQGMTLVQSTEPPLHVQAIAQEVFDVTGAGDTVVAVMAACMASNMELSRATFVANLAASLVVARLGTAVVSKMELNQALLALERKNAPSGILTVEQLVQEIETRKKKQQSVVMTNGCFDVLHAGHVHYLQQARWLGDCLIVAVNDDQSVKRLKGSERPIYSLEQRMQVLAALACVDYVVAFSEDTPKELIEKVTPNVLVKGGDYQVADVAGAAHVIASGGKVEILDFVPGCSSTRTIHALQSISFKQEQKEEVL